MPTADAQAKRSFLRDSLEVAICAAGIYACYITYGVLQEQILTSKHGPEQERFSFTWTLVFVQALFTAVVGLIWTTARPQPEHKVPIKDYFMIACTHVGAMVSSNSALGFVSYPTQVLAKSCKVVPVLLMRILRGFRWSLSDFVVVGCITSGISLFLLSQDSDRKAAKAAAAAAIDSTPTELTSEEELEQLWRSVYGYGLLCLSLALDAFTAPHEEVVKKRFQPSVAQMMFHLNLWSAVIMAGVMLVSGEWQGAWEFCNRHPAVLQQLLVLSLASAFGQIFILRCVFSFNSLVQTTITTTRKFFTILISVLWFGHSISSIQWLAIGLVFFGLGSNAYFKYSSHRSAAAAAVPEVDLQQVKGKQQPTKTPKSKKSRKQD